MKTLADPKIAKRHGIDLDSKGAPTRSSLEEWHRKNNPHLFADEQEAPIPFSVVEDRDTTNSFRFPLWVIPLIPIVVLVILLIK